MFWYRTTPKLAGSDGGTKSGPGEDEGSATEVVEDAVFVMTLANSDASVKVSIGGSGATFLVKKGVGMVKLPFNGRTGKVKVRILGKMGVGSRDIGNVALDGKVNFNVVVANTR